MVRAYNWIASKEVFVSIMSSSYRAGWGNVGRLLLKPAFMINNKIFSRGKIKKEGAVRLNWAEISSI